MQTQLERKVDTLIHEMREIKKELIADKIEKATKGTLSQKKIAVWKSLGHKVTHLWDDTAAVDEIVFQREKQS